MGCISFYSKFTNLVITCAILMISIPSRSCILWLPCAKYSFASLYQFVFYCLSTGPFYLIQLAPSVGWVVSYGGVICISVAFQRLCLLAGLRSRSRDRSWSRSESTILAGVGVGAGVGKIWSTPTPARSRRLTPGSRRWFWTNGYVSARKQWKTGRKWE